MTTIHFLNELRDSMVVLYLDYELNQYSKAWS